MVMEDDTVAQLELLTEEQKKQLQEAFGYAARRLKAFFDQLTAVMQKWFPVVSQAHRAYVKAVRTAYRRRILARRRRNRKR